MTVVVQLNHQLFVYIHRIQIYLSEDISYHRTQNHRHGAPCRVERAPPAVATGPTVLSPTVERAHTVTSLTTEVRLQRTGEI